LSIPEIYIEMMVIHTFQMLYWSFAAFYNFPPIKIENLGSIMDVYDGRVGAGAEVG